MNIDHHGDSSKTDQQIRVCLWSPWGAGNHYSGPGMAAYRLYSCDHDRKFAITLAHGLPHHERYERFDRQIIIRPIGTGLVNQMRFLRASRSWLAEHHGEFDVFHGLWGYEVVVGPAYFAHQLGLPAVARLAAHQEDLADKGGWKNWLGVTRRRRETIAKLDAVIAISQAIHEELRSYGVPESKIAMIPNGVDTARFRPCVDADEKRQLRESLGWSNTPVLLFIGAIEERKRPHLLVECIARLKRQGQECQLVLVGPERQRDYVDAMRETARDAGIEHLIHWAGMVKQVEQFCRASDLFGLPSAKEGMPNALLEAMASGLPAIVTAISGTTDLVEDNRSGHFVAPNAAAVTDAVLEYLNRPQTIREHGQCARDFVVAHRSAPATLDAHEQLFRRIMRGDPATV